MGVWTTVLVHEWADVGNSVQIEENIFACFSDGWIKVKSWAHCGTSVGDLTSKWWSGDDPKIPPLRLKLCKDWWKAKDKHHSLGSIKFKKVNGHPFLSVSKTQIHYWKTAHFQVSETGGSGFHLCNNENFVKLYQPDTNKERNKSGLKHISKEDRCMD